MQFKYLIYRINYIEDKFIVGFDTFRCLTTYWMKPEENFVSEPRSQEYAIDVDLVKSA